MLNGNVFLKVYFVKSSEIISTLELKIIKFELFIYSASIIWNLTSFINLNLFNIIYILFFVL